MPAIARWSRSSEWSRRESVAQDLGQRARRRGRARPARGAPSSASACSGVSSQTPARFFEPASVRTSSRAALEGEAERRRLRPLLAGAEAAEASGGHQVDEQDELAVVGREEEPLAAPLARRRSARPSSAVSGGSIVFSVATCAGPAFSIGKAETGSFSARRHASISGSSGTRLPAGWMPISVAVRRGGIVESVHRVHAVAVRDGEVVASAGDPGARHVHALVGEADPGSAARAARDDLDERDLAIASASHLADEAQLAAVQALLDKAPATEDDLECGPDGDPPRRINHNCSGKHAGMLALCRAKGWPFEGYRLAEHPCQQAMLAEVASAARNRIRLRPRSTAAASSRSPCRFRRWRRRSRGIDETSRRRAMRAYPELIRGPRGLDTNLMQALPGWIAKGGAEGLLCAAAPDGLGIALKVEDGSSRALRPALGSFLDALELDGSGFCRRYRFATVETRSSASSQPVEKNSSQVCG